MNEYIPHIPAKLKVPLNMNGMSGRMLYLPAKKSGQKQTLVVYGYYSNLERMYNYAYVLNRYGSVVVPDLPGFGGMQSFYTINKRPSLDNLADYIASLIKLKFKRGPITLVGFSFGFAVVTRMLQKYPEISKRTELVISVGGFAHYKDINLSKSERRIYKMLARLLSLRLPAAIARPIALNKTVLSRLSQDKYLNDKGLSKAQKIEASKFNTKSWHDTHLRTYAYTNTELLRLNNCLAPIDSRLWHLSLKTDTFLRKKIVKQHLRSIYGEVNCASLRPRKQNIGQIISTRDISAMLPRELKRQLSK
ncbi:MAG TPA: alpha/beta hydrolase [Candidatus Saccharimonadales bacterium]|nr:alpha/beta hydrolase [Candidatus Saccharimonadales bacterium]